MVSSGSKGSEENIGQICGSLAFLAVEGKLVTRFYHNQGARKFVSEVEINDLIIL